MTNFQKEPALLHSKKVKEETTIYGVKPLRVQMSSDLLKLEEDMPDVGYKCEVGKALSRVFVGDQAVARMTKLYSAMDSHISDVMTLGTNFTVDYTIIVSLEYKGKKYILSGRSSATSGDYLAAKEAVERAVMQLYVQAKYIIYD